EQGVDLMLSGHTHRGQIFPFNLIVKLFYPHFYGLYRTKKMLHYVTSGAFYWGPPMRLFLPSEIPLITLRAYSSPPN
ncbi:MAG: metallophosphoesterase, partial [Elusimicrobia bacterium]|nr:metallophosphoesterase [Elusimicrobiota bacterium]